MASTPSQPLCCRISARTTAVNSLFGKIDFVISIHHTAAASTPFSFRLRPADVRKLQPLRISDIIQPAAKMPWTETVSQFRFQSSGEQERALVDIGSLKTRLLAAHNVDVEAVAELDRQDQQLGALAFSLNDEAITKDPDFRRAAWDERRPHVFVYRRIV